MTILRLRGTLGLFLALTLALPAYTCEGYRAPDGTLVNEVPAGADSSTYVAAKVPHRPIDRIDPTELAQWITAIAYLWPLLLLGCVVASPRFGRHWTSNALELLLSVASGWWIWAAVVLGDIAYGAILSLATLGALFTVAFQQLIARRQKRSPGG